MKTAETTTATTTPKPSSNDVVVKEKDTTTTATTPVEFPELLNRYLEGIAKNGDIIFPWSSVKPFIRRKLEQVMDAFRRDNPLTETQLRVPNCKPFDFEEQKGEIMKSFDWFYAAPFTIQRLCELLIDPGKHYHRTDKFLRGLEKNVLVVSTVQPRPNKYATAETRVEKQSPFKDIFNCSKDRGTTSSTTKNPLDKDKSPNHRPKKGSALEHSKAITLSGYALIRDADQNKGLAFTKEERARYRLTGLLPAGIHNQSHQVRLVMEQIRAFQKPLNKYMLLRDLQDMNKQLFYRTLQLFPDELMPIVYTPVVGLACQEYSRIFKRPRGMYITAEDAGHLEEVFSNWDEPDIKAIVVTDGERILGLGDLGAHGMGISVGKLALYSALGGIPPGYTLPVCIDVGTNNAALRADPFYIGLHRERLTGAAYDALIDEFMATVVKRYGEDTLVQFEDFANHNAHRLLARYRRRFCTFNDDIQGTAAVSLAGLLTANRVTGQPLREQRILFMGAGSAAEGIAHLLVEQMKAEGATESDALSRISMFDIDGLLTEDRCPKATGEKYKYSKAGPPTKDLQVAVEHLRPTALIGVSAVAGAFTPAILQFMAQTNLRPLIFALSNPTAMSECTAEEAYSHTNGRALFASGSPFASVSFNGKTFEPGQCNNAYIFPAVALAVMACGVRRISDQVFIEAAKALASEVKQAELEAGRLYPRLHQIRPVTLAIGAKLAEWFYEQGQATVYPEPANKYDFLKGLQYEPLYDDQPLKK